MNDHCCHPNCLSPELSTARYLKVRSSKNHQTSLYPYRSDWPVNQLTVAQYDFKPSATSASTPIWSPYHHLPHLKTSPRSKSLVFASPSKYETLVFTLFALFSLPHSLEKQLSFCSMT